MQYNLTRNQYLLPHKTGVCAMVNINVRRGRPNMFDGCLHTDMALWERIRACGGLEKICCPRKYDVAPWLKMPADGRRFSKIFSIATPADNSTDTLVGSFPIAVGWDGAIQTLVHFYTGFGFNEGSGQLHFRWRINQRWIRDYGDVTTTLGSLTTAPIIYLGPIRLISRQVVSLFVNNTAGSGLAGGRIVGGAFGWTYPR